MMSLTKAVIVYLARSAEADVRDLCRSLTLLKKNFLNRFPYPVVVFVEPSFRETWKEEVKKKSGVACRFETVEFRIPNFLNPRTVPDFVYHPKFTVGYRHMCRFFSGTIYNEPALKGYRWYWRLDTDSFILGRVPYDVFKFMEKNQYVYGYIVMSRDEPTVTVGLWELTRRYLEDHNIKPTFIHDFVKDGVWDLSYYYTNFEISSLDFWRSAPVRDYFDHVDRSGGIYKHRWGDTLIHTMAVSMFLEKNKTHRFTDIYYDHQGPFNEPKRPVNYLRKVMRKIRDVCFFTPIN